MNWQDELREIVERELDARDVPSFQEWLLATGYGEMPETIGSPIQMWSNIRTLYGRYLNEYRRAA